MQTEPEQKLSPRAQRFDALDKKLGRLWNRFWALVVGAAGIAWLGWYFMTAENATAGSMTFAAIIGLVLLFVARVLWRSNDRVTDLIDDADAPVASRDSRNTR